MLTKGHNGSGSEALLIMVPPQKWSKHEKYLDYGAFYVDIYYVIYIWFICMID